MYEYVCYVNNMQSQTSSHLHFLKHGPCTVTPFLAGPQKTTFHRRRWSTVRHMARCAATNVVRVRVKSDPGGIPKVSKMSEP